MRHGCLTTVVVLFMMGICFFAGKLILDQIGLEMHHQDTIVKEQKEASTTAEEGTEETVQSETKQEGAGKERFYYEQLSKEEQKVYDKLLQGMEASSEKIRISYLDSDDINKIYKWILKDHPEIFWCDSSYRSVSYQGLTSYVIIKPEYLFDQEERNEKQREIDAEVDACLMGIDASASDYEKILYVYEYLVNSVDYEEGSEYNQTIYSIFVKKRSVCAGYAKAAQYLLNKLDVFCAYVTGTIRDSQVSHGWNLVRCEGDYYYVDPTWGDPLFQSGENEDIDNINYDYMCCNDEELFKTHKPEGDVSLPACTEMDWNYYVVNHMYYTQVDEDGLLRAMKDTIFTKEKSTTFKFASNSLYTQAREVLFDDLIRQAARILGNRYGVRQVKYSYLDDEERNKIVIYWNYK